MSQGNGAQKGHDENTSGKTPLDMVRDQHARDQQNLRIAREGASVEAENHEVEDIRIEAEKQVPGHAQPSDIRHHPQRLMR